MCSKARTRDNTSNGYRQENNEQMKYFIWLLNIFTPHDKWQVKYCYMTNVDQDIMENIRNICDGPHDIYATMTFS